MTWIEQPRIQLPEQDARDEREVKSLLEDIREALTLGTEFGALREIRDILRRGTSGAEPLESTYQDIRYVALRALRLGGRRGSALQNAPEFVAGGSV